MAIVEEAEFVEYLKNETGITDSPEIAVALATGISAVQNYCGPGGWRTFDLTAAEASARVYVPMSSTVVRVHDFYDTTGLIVSNDGTTVASGDYQLEPLNAAATGMPYEQIRLLSGSWTRNGQEATVTVTAKWGWNAVPALAKSAVRLIGKDYITGRGSKFGFTETSIGAVQGGRNWLALNALADLRRVEAFGLA